jgi:uncharacterized protein (DUF2062 family)
MALRLLAAVPFLGFLLGIEFFDRVMPFVFGVPMVLAGIVAWVILSALIIGIIYVCDPANREPLDPDERGPATAKRPGKRE